MDPDRFLAGAIKDIFENRHIIYCGGCVCHADDRCESAFCSGKGAGVNGLFVCESRIAEMDVGVDQSRGNGEPGRIDHFFGIRWSE